MCHVGDMHSNLIVAVFKLAERQGIVKVLRICRVDSECQYVPEVFSFCKIRLGYFL